MARTPLIGAVLATALVAGLPASAATFINFETGYVDNQELDDPVELLDSTGAPSGVKLITANANTMSIEASGQDDADPNGFVTDTLGVKDREVASAGSSLGGFFLRTTTALSGSLLPFNPVFSLLFENGSSRVSGEIWDIDGNPSQGTESWDLLAYNAAGSLLKTLSSPVGSTIDSTSLDGKEWAFDIADVGNISRLDFVFTGTKTRGIGAAIDNLEIAPVPLPASALLLLGGMGGLAVAARSRRKAA
jgi:hypothetical protein